MSAIDATDRRAVACLVAAFSIAYALVSLFRHWHFDSGYDLAIFDQFIWHLSRLEAPASSVRGYANILGDHFHPIVFLLAPLYWIKAAPETLLIAQAVLLGASILPVYLFARTRLSRRDTVLLSVAYGSFWGMQRTAWFDFHEAAFAPLIVATAILAVSRGQWTRVWIACVLMCLIKEDMIPLAAGFGAYMFGGGARRQGVALATASLAFLAVVLFLLIPSFSHDGAWMYGGAYRPFLERPWLAPLIAITPAVKAQTIVLWFLPFVLLPLRSPLCLLVMPIAASRLLSENPMHWGATFHYSAPLAPILAMAAADGLARLRADVGTERLTSRRVTTLLAVSVALAMTLPGHQPILRLLQPKHYRPIPTASAAARALALVPPDAPVTAQTPITPHLAHRHELYVLAPEVSDTEYLVASLVLDPWPNNSRDEIAALVADRQAQGYTTLFNEDGWVVLRKEK